MNIIVSTLCYGNAIKYAIYSNEINKLYCNKHNYKFYIETNNLDNNKHIYWTKIYLIKKLLQQNYDYIFFIDADACFANHEITIESFIDNNHSIFIANENKDLKPPHGENSGVILLKNNDISKKFIEDTLNLYEKFKNNVCPQQAAMGHLIDNQYSQHVKKLPCKLFNAYYGNFAKKLNKPWNNYSQGDFIIHLLRENEENRIHKFQQIIKKLKN